jgi:DNA-binding IscR family transcriptional regulator
MPCRRDTWNRCCRRSCAKVCCAAFGARGGGYALAREPKEISAEEILRAAGTVEDETSEPPVDSALVRKAVLPTVALAEQIFSDALKKVRVADMVDAAIALGCDRPHS